MDWTALPPLTSLRAFEAAARNASYSAAGRELNVSHAAVAQQVRALESFIGFRLAERSGRGIALTPEGTLLAGRLTEGFGQVAEAIRLLSAEEAARPIHVTMTPTFGVNWFLPRMPMLRAAHPDIDLMVNPTAEVISFADSGCDAAIRFGTGGWDNLESERLVPSNFVIVAAPALVPDDWSGNLEDLLGMPWLQELGTAEVQRWLDSLGIERPPPAHITSLPGYMVLSAIREGQGIAATARAFVEDDLAVGRLISLYEPPGGEATGYHLVWRKGIQRPALKQFLSWIRRTAREDIDQPHGTSRARPGTQRRRATME